MESFMMNCWEGEVWLLFTITKQCCTVTYYYITATSFTHTLANTHTHTETERERERRRFINFKGILVPWLSTGKVNNRCMCMQKNYFVVVEKLLQKIIHFFVSSCLWEWIRTYKSVLFFWRRIQGSSLFALRLSGSVQYNTYTCKVR